MLKREEVSLTKKKTGNNEWNVRTTYNGVSTNLHIKLSSLITVHFLNMNVEKYFNYNTRIQNTYIFFLSDSIFLLNVILFMHFHFKRWWWVLGWRTNANLSTNGWIKIFHFIPNLMDLWFEFFTKSWIHYTIYYKIERAIHTIQKIGCPCDDQNP